MFKHMISCAANVVDVSKDGKHLKTLVLPDNCHFGRNIQVIMKFLREEGYTVKANKDGLDRGQGFIDESGVYMGRGEAYTVAKESGQPFNDEHILPENKLDSSCIRHFPADCDLKDYTK